MYFFSKNFETLKLEVLKFEKKTRLHVARATLRFSRVRGAKAMNAHPQPQEAVHDYDVVNGVGIEV
jgi:hypothetical protein